MNDNILKPCPFCKSTNVEEDYTSTFGCRTLSQEGYVECNNCGAQGPYIEAADDDGLGGLSTLSERVINSWNKSE